MPDLVETALSNPPSIALPGSSFAATDTVLNQGGATAAASTTRYYLSLDAVKDSGDICPGARSVPSLAWGASSVGLPVTLTIPSTTPLRKYYVLACADDAALVTETDDDNNCLAATGEVQVTQPGPRADGGVRSAGGGGPREQIRGRPTRCKNQGAWPLRRPARATISRPTRRGAVRHPAGRQPGRSPARAGRESSGAGIMVTVPSTTSLGLYYLLACADDTTLVTEGPVRATTAGRDDAGAGDADRTSCKRRCRTRRRQRRAGAISVTDTVQEQGAVASAGPVTRYYCSADQQRSSGDTMLAGNRSVPGLAPGASSSGARESW